MVRPRVVLLLPSYTLAGGVNSVRPFWKLARNLPFWKLARNFSRNAVEFEKYEESASEVNAHSLTKPPRPRIQTDSVSGSVCKHGRSGSSLWPYSTFEGALCIAACLKVHLV